MQTTGLSCLKVVRLVCCSVSPRGDPVLRVFLKRVCDRPPVCPSVYVFVRPYVRL